MTLFAIYIHRDISTEIISENKKIRGKENTLEATAAMGQKLVKT